MAPPTRPKKKVDYTQRALEAAQQNQNVNQEGRSQSQSGRSQARKSAPKARDPRVNSEGRSAIRKARASTKQRRSTGWRRTCLPEFDIAKWRIRAGVPVVMLRLLNPDDATMTDDSESFEEIEVDIESNHSIPFVNDDQPQDDVQPLGEGPPKSSNEPLDVNQPAEHDQLPGDEDLPISVSSGEIDPNLEFASEYSPIPEDVHERRLPIEGEPREADVKKYGMTFAKFITSPFGLWNKETGEKDTGWVGQKPLGKGGYGMAGLWQKTLQDGTVKSMVIKQTRCRWWKGEIWKPDVPTEVVALETIKKGPIRPTGCIDYFDYQRYPAREVHRIYMEYAPYGDLFRLIQKYRAKKRLIPEAFIWDVFFRLAKACLAMANTRCGRGHAHCEEWVHLDIKPDNVFLAEMEDWDKDSYPFYATAKLGDFNGAACLGNQDLWNPFKWKGSGTPNYRPLEHQYFFADNPRLYQHVSNYEQAKRRYRWLKHKEMDHEPPPLGAYTNVWGVGAVIFELMTLKQVGNYLYTTRETQKDAEEALPQETIDSIIANYGYSADLVNLVAACLRPNPTQRPSVGDVEEAAFEGRFMDYGNLRDWYNDGDKQLDKYLIPWDNLDGMAEKEEWFPSQGHGYEAPYVVTAVRAGRTSVREVKREKKGKTAAKPTAPGYCKNNNSNDNNNIFLLLLLLLLLLLSNNNNIQPPHDFARKPLNPTVHINPLDPFHPFHPTAVHINPPAPTRKKKTWMMNNARNGTIGTNWTVVPADRSSPV
ncbi:MAG: hypothetical protein Q9194_007434 [Teloschistes cf. exilis]